MSFPPEGASGYHALMRSHVALSLVVILLGCGGSGAPKADAPKTESSASSSPKESPAEPAEASKAEEDSKKIPEACAGDDKAACVMPGGFVRRLCAGAFPDLAIMFFQSGTPWR